jgi:hypothetical protein
MFKSGDNVALKVKTQDNTLGAIGPKITDIVGVVQRSAAYDPVETIRVFTGNKNFPVSVIRTQDIIENNGKIISLVKTDVQVWEVKGSKGGSYTVTRSGNNYQCTCSGFQFRRKCKHVDSVAK